MMPPISCQVIMAERQVELKAAMKSLPTLADRPDTLPRWRRWVGTMMVNVGVWIMRGGELMAQRQFDSERATLARTRHEGMA